MSQVVVQPYDPSWPVRFAEIAETLWPSLDEFALRIEHVGSTAVPGLAAKPVLDIDIVIPDASFLSRAIQVLAKQGYEHRGNMGIVDRETFRTNNPAFKHNLYVCPQESLSLRNHLCLRNALRKDLALRDEYAALKRRLAAQFPDSIDDYIEGKTAFILKILESHGLAANKLEVIRLANLAPKK